MAATFLIADDHEIYRDGLVLLLSRQPEFQVLGDASNGKQLVELALKLKPDIVITDILMPEMDGMEATRILLRHLPSLKVIALSMYQEESLVVEMLEAGARGYLLKNADKLDILDAVDAVMNDGCWFCHRSSGKLTRLIASSRFEMLAKQHSLRFTPRERDVIRLICKEYSSREIGEELNIGIRTVEGLRAVILEKMNVRNSVGLAVFALRNGLISEADMKE